MRLALALAATVLLLSGCLASSISSSSSRTTCVNGNCVECREGACQACDTQDNCAPCDGDGCDACLDGECAALDAGSDPPADVRIDQTYDLTEGLPETSWTFDVGAGATSRARWVLRDVVIQQAVAGGNVCLRYERHSGTSTNSGGAGSCCDGGISVCGPFTDEPLVLLDWKDLQPGRYVVTATASVQPHELVVEVDIDNPEPVDPAA